MRQQELNMLDDEQLIWKCVEPIIQKVRGRNPTIKSQVVMQLNNEQRALFVFQVLYGHANDGILSFFKQISYLADRLDIWDALKSAMEFFNDAEMLSIIKKMETAYYVTVEHRENTIPMDELDGLYAERIPFTLQQVGSFVRHNPAEYMSSFIT